MNNFPRRGHSSYDDDGSEVGTKSKCPNCNSDKYKQTISTESCSHCGLFFDYWAVNGEHGNEIYQAMEKRQRQAEAWAEYKREQEMFKTDDDWDGYEW